jgi:uncharacterized cofD-like protein
VSVFDNGGHAGQLRKRGHQALGDIRRVLEALASDDAKQTLFYKIFTHRFLKNGSSALNDWSMGNLVLATLIEKCGGKDGLVKAIGEVSVALEVESRVLPVSLDNSHLRTYHYSGGVIHTEGELDGRPFNSSPIMCSLLTPDARICPATDLAIRRSKDIIFPAGSLWPSILVNPMVIGFLDAVHYALDHGARVTMITNLMMHQNELPMEQNTTAHLVHLLCSHLRVNKIHAVLCNTGPFPDEVLKKYATQYAYPVRYVETDEAEVNISGNFASWDEKGVVRHNQHTIERLFEL